MDLLLVDLTEGVDLGGLTRDGALDHLDPPADEGALGHGVGGGDGLHLDDADAWVVLAAVVGAVPQVTHPGLEGRGVVLPDHVPVGDDGGGAGDAGPAAVGRTEGDVDVGVGFEVVGLAGLGVCVEEEVDSAGFLKNQNNKTKHVSHRFTLCVWTCVVCE